MGIIHLVAAGDVILIFIELFVSNFLQYIAGCGLEMLDQLYKLVLLLLEVPFFTHDFVQGAFMLFEILGGVMLGVGLVKVLLGELERQSHGEGFHADRLLSFFKGFGLLLFCRPVVFASHEFITEILLTISAGIQPEEMNFSLVDFSSVVTSILFTVVLLVSLIVTVLMVVTLCKQFAIIFLQVLTGYLYVYDVASGNDAAIGEWGRDVIGSRIAYALQLILYEIGMMEAGNALIQGDLAAGFTAIIMLVAVGVAPTVLKKWGFASQTTAGGAFGRFVTVAATVAAHAI